MKFTKEFLQKILYDENENLVINEHVESGRWHSLNRLVFKYNNNYYEVWYKKGLTEHQDEEPFEYGPDIIECKEVFPVEKLITMYE